MMLITAFFMSDAGVTVCKIGLGGINESKNVSTKVGARLVAVKLQAVAEIHKKNVSTKTELNVRTLDSNG